MITEELLLEKGYREFEVNKMFHPHAAKFFQKRFRNEKDQTKYFISIYKYEHDNREDNYEIGLQFEQDRYVMNIQIFAIDKKMTIEEIEQEVYAIWYGLRCKYYDNGEE